MGQENLIGRSPLIAQDKIGREDLDRNLHANHASQVGKFKKYRVFYMAGLGKAYIDRFGTDPFIAYLKGKYHGQMIEGQSIAVSTNARVSESEIIFRQSFSNDQGRKTTDFQFTVLPIGQAGTIDHSLIKRETESATSKFVTEKVDTLGQWFDGSDQHMSVQGYLLLCEIQRTEYFNKLVMGAKEFKTKFNLTPVVHEVVRGDCVRPISKEESLTACTVAKMIERDERRILFVQSIFSNGKEIARFLIEEALIDAAGQAVPIPEEIVDKLSKINAENKIQLNSRN